MTRKKLVSKKNTYGVHLYAISTIVIVQIQIESIVTKLGQLINNAMQGKIVFHMSGPDYWI
jgi:hypothetical protein